MRLGKWLLMLVVLIICMMAGIYFGRTINSKETSQTSPELQLVLTGPTGSSPSALQAMCRSWTWERLAPSKSGVSTSPRAAMVPSGPIPIIEWSMGATVGDLVPDVTGHGFDARIHGQPGLKPTWDGRMALEFDGQGNNDFWHDHSLNCGLSVEKRLDRAFTELSVEAWIRKTPGNWMPIIYRDKWDESYGFGLYTEWSSGKAVFGHYDNSGHKSGVQSDRVVQDGQWHHLVGTMQAAGDGCRYCIYVDGNLDSEQTGSWGVTAAPPEGGILMIAYPNASGADQPYQGGLGGIAIFDVALAAAQVKARFEAQRAGGTREMTPMALGALSLACFSFTNCCSEPPLLRPTIADRKPAPRSGKISIFSPQAASSSKIPPGPRF